MMMMLTVDDDDDKLIMVMVMMMPDGSCDDDDVGIHRCEGLHGYLLDAMDPLFARMRSGSQEEVTYHSVRGQGRQELPRPEGEARLFPKPLWTGQRCLFRFVYISIGISMFRSM